MKIYFLVFDIFGMGGTVRTVLNVTNYLAQKGYDIEIVSVFRHRKVPFFYIDPRIEITILHDIVIRDKNDKRLRTKIANTLAKMKSRLIHTDDEGYHFFSVLSDIKMYSYLKSLKTGILVTTRPSFNLFASKYAKKNMNLIGQEHLNFAIYPEKLKKSILKDYINLDYLATLTDDDTEDYNEILKNGKVKVKKITNSIPQFQGVQSSLESKSVLAAGRLVEQKGFDLLIEAWSMVKEEYPDWKLKIFGSGRDRAKLEKLIEEYHLYNHVYLMGPTQDMDLELSKSSIYALSSRFEGFGMVIVEAMQVGVPVVSFDCPKGPAEIIRHNEDGLLVENGNIEAFAQSLMELMGDKEKRERFSKNAIQNVKRYEIKNIGQIWEETIFRIVNGAS